MSTDLHMVVIRNLSMGGATSRICLSFSAWSCCNANGHSQDTLLLLHPVMESRDQFLRVSVENSVS